MEEKRKILSLMFPENIVFDRTQHRTQRLNAAIILIYQKTNELKGNKKGTNLSFFDLSQEVDPQGLEPRITVPKTGVLPLHHGSSVIACANIKRFFFLPKEKIIFFLLPFDCSRRFRAYIIRNSIYPSDFVDDTIGNNF